MKKIRKNLSFGFTLIELLVVIAIIGVLASVVLASVNTARAKSRDARRKADLNQLRLALELYYDANGAYPPSAAGPNWYSSEPGDNGSNNGGNWIPGLTPTYIPSLPRDSLGGAGRPSAICTSWRSAFLYIANVQGYTLLGHCSPEVPWTSSDSFYDTFRPTHAWKICVNLCV